MPKVTKNKQETIFSFNPLFKAYNQFLADQICKEINYPDVHFSGTLVLANINLIFAEHLTFFPPAH